jgi:hypothetical protein
MPPKASKPPARPEIDPQLLALKVPVPPPTQPILGTSNHVNLPPSNMAGFKTPARELRPSTFGFEKLDNAVTKAKESFKTIPSKHGLHRHRRCIHGNGERQV